MSSGRSRSRLAGLRFQFVGRFTNNGFIPAAGRVTGRSPYAGYATLAPDLWAATRCRAGTVVGTGSVGETGSGTGMGTGLAGPPSYRKESLGLGDGMRSGTVADGAVTATVLAPGRRVIEPLKNRPW